MNNDRIRRQQGAFLVHSPAFYIENLKNNIISPHENIYIRCVSVSRRAKNKILNELEQIGITYSYLFPELDRYAPEIKRRIRLGSINPVS
jgi:hypothetical protein